MLKVPTYFLGPSKRKFRNERYPNENTQRRRVHVSKTTLNTTIEHPGTKLDQIAFEIGISEVTSLCYILGRI